MNAKYFFNFFHRSLILIFIFSFTHCYAVDADKLSQLKKTSAALYVDSKEAYELKEKMGDKALFVDVRTRSEIAYLGMPLNVDVHIPYLEHPFDAGWDEKNSRFQIEPNSAFTMEIEKRLAEKKLDKSAVVILICRSGDRSAKAANLLYEIGYKKVFTVVDGFEGDIATTGPQMGQRVVNGWKNAGLPWSYKLDRKKIYLPSN